MNTISLDSVETNGDFRKLVNDQDLFFTFNYTDTLEEVYGIQEDNICHIHGKQNEEIFFGHGNFEDYTGSCIEKHIGTQDSLSKIYDQLRKRTDEALDNNLDFFYSLEEADINKIYSYGFSFSEVDMVYLQEICNQVNTKNMIWYFNNFDVSKHNKYKDVLRKCGYTGAFNTFHIKLNK
ncbi:AbiH family protein [Peribacillus frigoritolerans]|uniref:AbiH family protein n=1 Tax=Peribacillus frigoritolerans TaxID=450367 RepID=UPI0035CF3A25